MIQERKAKVLQLAERHAFELRQTYVGKKRWVLFENDGGHTDNFLRVNVEGMRPNDLSEVEFIENEADALIGKLLV